MGSHDTRSNYNPLRPGSAEGGSFRVHLAHAAPQAAPGRNDYLADVTNARVQEAEQQVGYQGANYRKRGQ